MSISFLGQSCLSRFFHKTLQPCKSSWITTGDLSFVPILTICSKRYSFTKNDTSRMVEEHGRGGTEAAGAGQLPPVAVVVGGLILR